MIDFYPVHGEFMQSVMIDKILRLSKTEGGEHTQIHLVNGEVLLTTDSMKTISARVNSHENS